jgi:hypothetical protein
MMAKGSNFPFALAKGDDHLVDRVARADAMLDPEGRKLLFSGRAARLPSINANEDEGASLGGDLGLKEPEPVVKTEAHGVSLSSR